MKISLAFLLLGTCLVFTNANVIGKQHAHQVESFSHGRMMSLPMKRWQELQDCHACSQTERNCILRILISDCFCILKVVSKDLETDMKKLLSVKTSLKISFLIDSIKKNDIESYLKHLEKTNSINHFMQFMCLVMQKPMAEAGLDLGHMLNSILGDVMVSLVGALPEVLGSVFGTVSNLAGGIVDAVGGLTNAFGGIANGLGGLAGGGGGKGYRG